MTTQVMIDIETMGLGPAAAVISIGAVKFNPYGVPGELATDPNDPNLMHSFSCNVDLESAMIAGLQVTGGTIMWWLKQSEEARNALTANPLPLDAALARFHAWYGTDALPTWANGIDFDCTILKTAYLASGYDTPPWRYDSVRDYRTMRVELEALFPHVQFVPPAVKHNAYQDALAQATHLQKLYTALAATQLQKEL